MMTNEAAETKRQLRTTTKKQQPNKELEKQPGYGDKN